MATVAMDVSQPSALPAAGAKAASAAAKKGSGVGEGLGRYYKHHIHDLRLAIPQRENDLGRQKAQRNAINSQGIEARRLPQTLNPLLSTP